MVRVFRWLGWSVAVALTPYFGLLLIMYIEVQDWPGWTPILGSGQLLLTSVALVAGGVRELSGMHGVISSGSRDFLLLSSLIFAVMAAMTYGYLARTEIRGSPLPSSQQELVVVLSAACLFVGIVIGALCIAVSSPGNPLQEAANG